MATPWLEAFPTTVKPFLEEMDSILSAPLSDIIASGPNSKLNATENSQPAIMAMSVLILRVLEKEFGFKTSERVDVTLGHSLGEYAALIAAGYLDYATSLKMVRRRGEIMAQCTKDASEASGGDQYGMMALMSEDDRLDSLVAAIHDFLSHGKSKDDSSYSAPPIQQVLIANINSRNQIVLSGSIERIKALLVNLRQFGGHDPRAVRLKSDSPFHSPIMAPAYEYMKRTMQSSQANWPGIMPCISNVSAQPFQSKEDLVDLLSRQAIDTVQWWGSIKYLDQERGVKRWIGLGPGKVGRNLVGKEVGRVPAKGGGVWAISDPNEIEGVLKSLEETESMGREESF